MTEVLRNWVLGLAGTAVICAGATLLTPKGRVHKVVRMLCGILMTAALLSPLFEMDFSDYSLYLSQFRQRAARLTNDTEELSRNLDRTYIEENLKAYILDKAVQLEAELRDAEVELRWDSAGVWVPVSVKLSGPYHERLSCLLEAELGIPANEQTWRNDENP